MTLTLEALQRPYIAMDKASEFYKLQNTDEYGEYRARKYERILGTQIVDFLERDGVVVLIA